ncbi:MAG: 4'-phosphopantetheinyl transferase superfamily protein, partial [Propionibacteriaceae bacterium]|nr:4'-phosphopantetheinyl transferase superfamily protein [Propionibacteriaceae bacterium]
PREAMLLLADTAADASWARRRGDVLTPAEAERASRFVFADLGERWTAARVLLREVLGRATHTAAADVPISVGEHGKPMADGLEFSLAHSGSLVLIGVGALPLGVDVEGIPDDRAVAQIGTSLHPRETEELRGLPSEQRCEAFTRLWVRKEAMYKALGIGLLRGLSHDYVGFGAMPHSPIRGLRIHDVPLPAGMPSYRAALCVTQPEDSPKQA